VLQALGSERAFVVRGADGLDEITLTGPSTVSELREGAITTYEVEPADFGFEAVPPEALKGGTPADNAGILTAVLDSEAGAARNVVVMNAAAAIAAGGLTASLEEGAAAAREAIDSGRARQALQTLVDVSNG